MVNELLVSFSYGFWGEAITSISYTLGNTDKLSTGYGGYQAEGHFSAITFDGHLHKKNVLVILIIKRRLEKTREKEDEEVDLKKKEGKKGISIEMSKYLKKYIQSKINKIYCSNLT